MFNGPVAMIRTEERSSPIGAAVWASAAEERVASTEMNRSVANMEREMRKVMAAIRGLYGSGEIALSSPCLPIDVNLPGQTPRVR